MESYEYNKCKHILFILLINLCKLILAIKSMIYIVASSSNAPQGINKNKNIGKK